MPINQTQQTPASPRPRFFASRARRIALTLLLLFIFPISSLAQSTLERVKKDGELRIGTDATYPPFEFRADNRRSRDGDEACHSLTTCDGVHRLPRFSSRTAKSAARAVRAM